VNTETLPGKGKARRRRRTTPADLGLGEEPPQTRPDDSVATHVRAQLDVQVRELLAREHGTRSGTDPEDLHQMRVAVRRIRSVLKLSGALLGPMAEPVRAELGWLGQSLGDVRDYDVLIGHLRAVVAEFDARDQLAAQELVAKFVADRAVAKRRLTKALSSARYATVLQNIAQLARQPEQEPELEAGNGAAADSTASADLLAGLRKPYQRLIKAVIALPPDPPDDDLHALRIHGKRLRYAAELARTATKKKQAGQIRDLITATKDLQTVLGDHQDAVIAADRMRSILYSLDARTGFIAGRIAEIELRKRAHARAEWPTVWAKVDAAARGICRHAPVVPGVTGKDGSPRRRRARRSR
jgi:CHAD domain-containing protein